MKTLANLAKQYINFFLSIGHECTNQDLLGIARENLADLKSNRTCSWVEFCDGSVLSLEYGEAKAYRKLTKKHVNGANW